MVRLPPHRTPNRRKADRLLTHIKSALKFFRYDSDNSQAMEIVQPRTANLAEALKMKLIICFRHLKCICRKWCRGMGYSWHVQHLLCEFGCGPLADFRSVSDWKETSREATQFASRRICRRSIGRESRKKRPRSWGVRTGRTRCAKPSHGF